MKTIILSSTFNTNAEFLYKFFTDSKLHTEITGSKAIVNNKIGGKFSAWDGYITGEITGLKKNKKIVQKWRTTEFNETDKDSVLEITIEDIDKNKSRMQLKHDGLPKGTEEDYKNGWKEYYIQPLKEFIKKQKIG
jgi:activator of HSP90 ATPase